MRELTNRVAVVTGGASGIGRGMAIAFADAGMHVVLADIEADAAAKVAGEIEARGVRALAVHTDVVRLDSLEALAERAWAEFGGVHVLCNNAGVACFAPLAENTAGDWQWLLGVNLAGVANGLQAFLPRMLAAGAEGHIVNTASMAGLIPVPTLGIYVATKYAVVGITETLRIELAETPISCSVLCPGVVDTRIFESERNRPQQFSENVPPELPAVAQAMKAASAKNPLEVGRMVRQALLDDDLYIFSHPDAEPPFEERAAGIRAAFEKWRGWSDH